MDPLDIFPQAVWPLIFEKLEDPQDWLNLYRTSSTFEGIVGKERPSALLSQVFPHVEKHLNLKVNLKELLGLRLVSRQWRKLVDSTLETPEEFGTDLQGHLQERMYIFVNPVSISSFLERFGSHPGNPLVGRTVMVSSNLNDSEVANAEYLDLMFRLMERFGEHIRKLYVGTYGGTSPALDNFLHRLQTILAFVPNLESLAVLLFGRGDIDYLIENPTLDDQQFPIISNLKYFSFVEHVGADLKLLAELQNLLVRMCCNPATLKAARVTGVPSELAPYPNLDTAVLRVTSLGNRSRGFGIPSHISWPLTRLILCPNHLMDLPQVLAWLEPFKETLTSLTIPSRCGRYGKDQVLKFDLPHLKYLQLPLRPDGLVLLTSLSNLKFLAISRLDMPFQAEQVPRLSDEEKLKVVSDLMKKEMLECKVWEVLPKLRQIRLDGCFVMVVGDVQRERKAYSKMYAREMFETGGGNPNP